MKEAIVLAGGLGTRLRAVVPDLPKPMAPVAGRPFLEILLGKLASSGFGRVVLSVGHRAGDIVGHFGAAFNGMALEYAVEVTPLGTGGGLRAAFERTVADAAFVFNGDTYLDLEVADVEAQWQRKRIPLVVARMVDDTSRYGRIVTEGHRIVRFDEKGVAGRGLINAGCYVFPKSIVAAFPDKAAFSLEGEFLVTEAKRGALGVFVSRGHFIDIGVPEDYSRAQVELRTV